MSKKHLRKKIHLVTSGCSFSDNSKHPDDVVHGRWPHFVAKRIDAKLYNRGEGSCGNDWISKSVIYETQKLLDNGINPQNILVMVMWSGIDRKGKFISRQETNNFKQYPNYIRLDVKLGYKWNNPKTAWEFGLDISNITNRQNLLTLTYIGGLENAIREEYQLGLFPVFYLRCDF